MSHRVLRVSVVRPWAGLAALLVVAGAQAAESTAYFTDLGTLGGNYSSALGVNDLGQVVGTSSTAVSGSSHATLWTRSGVVDLGAFEPDAFSQAQGINNSGQVVGTVHDRATLWNDSPAGVRTLDGWAANGINARGDISGISNAGGRQYATRWSGTTATLLPPIGGAYSGGTGAFGINGSGQVVGWTYATDNPNLRHATLWDGSTPTDLSTFAGLPGRSSYARASNDVGQVIGGSWVDDELLVRATIWQNGTAAELPTLGTPTSSASFANAINDAGDVVGSSIDLGVDPLPQRATLWRDGIAIDLNGYLDVATRSAGWHLDSAAGINDAGWIVGTASNTLTGVSHAFLLSAVPIPEAPTGTLLIVGLCGVGTALRARPRWPMAPPRGWPAAVPT